MGRQPDKFNVQKLSVKLDNAKLHDFGVVLLPVWVIEYKWKSDGVLYRGFVNGQNGKASGPIHYDPLLTTVASGVGGSVLSGSVGVQLVDMDPVALAMGLAGGLSGAYLGRTFTNYQTRKYQEELEAQGPLRMANDAHGHDPHWD